MHSVLAMTHALLWSSSSALCGPPSAEQMRESWGALQPIVAAQATFPIVMQPRDFEAMGDGKIAKRRIREDGPDRAMGAMWAPLDRNQIWVAILDDAHDNLVSALTETRLGPSQQGNKLLYQHLDLPWPVQDRQLVVEIQNNTEIARATEGVLWERSWDLADSKLMTDADPHAIWVPLATGSWLLFPVEDGTIVVYHARSTIGGRIPDEIVTRWAMATVDEMMVHIVDRAREITGHYTEGHEIFFGGDNQPIKPF